MCMSKRIKLKRKEKGYTQEELAEKLGLQKSAIAKYESGRVENIKRSVILNMSILFDCSPSYLLGWEDEETKKVPELLEDEKEMLNIYNQLDEGDKGELRGIGKGMLRAEKYKSYKSKLQA